MSNLQLVLNSYGPDDIEEFMSESIVPAHCEDCGLVVTEAEPDASWVGGGHLIECSDCGPGTRITSVVQLLLF